MGGEHHFPEPIIQHIQSFLTRIEAARTTVLSKSWGGAWLTRPNLEFDRTDFPPRRRGRYLPDPLSQFADKTLKRYEDSKLNIESFSIRTDEINPELIARAFKIGATRLSVRLQNDVVFPDEVVFGSENLVSLSVEGCAISLRKETVFRCSALRFLCLDSVFVRSFSTITRILSSCPSIERLSLSNLYEAPDPDDNGNNDDDDSYDDDDDDDDVLNVLPGIRSLVLKSVCQTLFLRDISTIFPSLKELTLLLSSGFGAELISSRSIERLDIAIGEQGPRRVILDVPNIRKLIYHGSVFPSFSFKSNSRGYWESHSNTTRGHVSSDSWFGELSKFLTKLKRSEIHLSLCVSYGMSLRYKPGEIRFRPALEIENLAIEFEGTWSLSSYALLDALFRICRPKSITQSASRLRRALLRGVDAEMLSPNQFMYGLNDLKEAKAQIFDETVSTWRDVSLDALSSEDCRKVRFQLDWATAA